MTRMTQGLISDLLIVAGSLEEDGRSVDGDIVRDAVIKIRFLDERAARVAAEVEQLKAEKEAARG